MPTPTTVSSSAAAPTRFPRLPDPRRWRFWPAVPVMDRYIFQELLSPFLFGVAAFTSVGLSIGVVFDLVRQVTESGLPTIVALQVFLLKLPDFMVLAFPMSILLASLMAYNRLSSDSELVALRSCGISAYRFIIPAIALSVMVTGLTFVFNESIVPAANFQAKLTLETALRKERPQLQQKDNIVYQQFTPGSGALSRIFYAKRYDGSQMLGLTVLDFTRGALDQIIKAESANWNPQTQAWEFRNGQVIGTDGKSDAPVVMQFSRQEFRIPQTPLDIASQSRDETQMNIAQISDYLRLLREANNTNEIRKMEVRLQQKLSLPFVCLVFGLVGSALGIVPNQRTSRATGFGISVLIIFTYYLLSFVSGALGINGTIPPLLAGWFPALLGGGIGVYLLTRAAR